MSYSLLSKFGNLGFFDKSNVSLIFLTFCTATFDHIKISTWHDYTYNWNFTCVAGSTVGTGSNMTKMFVIFLLNPNNFLRTYWKVWKGESNIVPSRNFLFSRIFYHIYKFYYVHQREVFVFNNNIEEYKLLYFLSTFHIKYFLEEKKIS